MSMKWRTSLLCLLPGEPHLSGLRLGLFVFLFNSKARGAGGPPRQMKDLSAQRHTAQGSAVSAVAGTPSMALDSGLPPAFAGAGFGRNDGV